MKKGALCFVPTCIASLLPIYLPNLDMSRRPDVTVIGDEVTIVSCIDTWCIWMMENS